MANRGILVGTVISSAGVATFLACVGEDPSGTSPTPEIDGSTSADGSSTTGETDSGTDSANVSDGGRCDPTKPFGARKPLDGINIGNERNQGARLADGEKMVYFSSFQRDGGIGSYDTWVAMRPSPNDPFDDALLLNGGNDAEDERFPTVTADGLTLYTMYFPGGNWDIYRATRNSVNEPFPKTTNVAEVSMSPANDHYPYVLPNGSALYFDSDRSNEVEIYRASVVGGVVQDPVLVQGISASGKNASAPWVSADELTMYFASSRSGGQGGHDIYVTRRASTASVFGTPVLVPELSTSGDDLPNWFSEDGCVAVWSTNVGLDGGNIGAKVYISERRK